MNWYVPWVLISSFLFFSPFQQEVKEGLSEEVTFNMISENHADDSQKSGGDHFREREKSQLKTITWKNSKSPVK